MHHLTREYKDETDWGKYYGYPSCCIDEFVEEKNCRKRQKAMKHIVSNSSGFIPCLKHARMIMRGQCTLSSLIDTKTRKHFESFESGHRRSLGLMKLCKERNGQITKTYILPKSDISTSVNKDFRQNQLKKNMELRTIVKTDIENTFDRDFAAIFLMVLGFVHVFVLITFSCFLGHELTATSPMYLILSMIIALLVSTFMYLFFKTNNI